MDARRYRSLFWPVLLIGVGVIWLLGSMGVIAPVTPGMVLRFWPVLLIVAGLDMLFGRQSPVLGAVIGLLAVVAVLFLLVAGPTLGLVRSAELTTDHFVEAMDGAQSADVYLDLGFAPTRMHTLTDSDDLFDATIVHLGDVTFKATGEANRSLRLVQSGNVDLYNFPMSMDSRWEIGMAADVPTKLTIDSGSGSVDADLSGMNLTGFKLDSGSGSIDVVLPATDEPYKASFESGSGSLELEAPCGVDVRINSGSGSVSINVPDDCPVRVEVVDDGSGSVSVRNDMEHVVDRGDDEGVWESADFDEDAEHITIQLDQGSGSFRVR